MFELIHIKNGFHIFFRILIIYGFYGKGTRFLLGFFTIEKNSIEALFKN